MMDWSTFWIIAAMAATYSLGKGIGRAQGREIAERNQYPGVTFLVDVEGDRRASIHISKLDADGNPLGDRLDSYPPPL